MFGAPNVWVTCVQSAADFVSWPLFRCTLMPIAVVAAVVQSIEIVASDAVGVDRYVHAVPPHPG